jgi:peptidoglycan/LPS O-acetylase OafA/YrhL
LDNIEQRRPEHLTVSPATRVPALDGIRAVAVLFVVFLHTGIFPYGWLGVDVFFVLSGFLITGILLDAKQAGGGGWKTYGKPFYARRSLRIIPLAYVALAVVFLILPGVGVTAHVPGREQFFFWAYISNWMNGPRSLGSWRMAHYWSLAVEEQFYICWPWIVLAVSRRKLELICIALLIIAPLLRLGAINAHIAAATHFYDEITPFRMDGLAAGALLAAVSRDRAIIQLKNAGAWMLILGSIVFVAVAVESPERYGYVFEFSSIAAAATGALILVVAFPTSVACRLLSISWVRWIGTVSYGVYIIHYPIAFWMKTHGIATPVSVFATLSLTLAAAAISWYVMERPILGLKKYWPMPAGN